MIDQARRSVASVVNTHLIALNWQMGRRIRSEILKKKRAGYGEEILATVSQELTKEYGQGFTLSSLSRMLKFAELFPDEQIVATLSQQLSWSHFVEILPLKEPLKRDFYVLEFLNLNDRYVEKDVEDAIIRELEQFLLELGVGFTFVERQKRIIVDDEDFHLDLLFFHRKLKRLVPPMLEKWQPLLNVEVKEWGVKKMKTKWVSCNTSERRIWTNLELIKKPIQCLEYIVVHELVHLLEKHHNARFKAHMDNFMPHWRLHKEELGREPLGHDRWNY